MKTITNYTFYLLAIAMAFGSFNPFDLHGAGDIAEQIEEQRGFTPILFGLCMIFSLLDKNVRIHYLEFRKFYSPLLALLFCYILSSVVYDINTISDFYGIFVKLFIVFTGFISFSMYFYEYPNVRRQITLVFSGTCSLICLAFFCGLLDGFYYFSNGRLWLFGENPNSYSFVLGVGALILSNEYVKNDKVLYKAVCVVAVVLIIMYTIMSGSRGTLMFLGVGLLIIFFEYIKKHIVTSTIALILGYSLLNYMFFINAENLSIMDRFAALQQGDGRIELINNALSLFYDSPIYGYGVNGYDYMKEAVFHDMRDSHNMLVSILAVSGMMGFYAIMTFFVRFAISLKKKSCSHTFAVALFVYVFLISMKTGGIITYSMMWFTYAVILSLSRCQMPAMTRWRTSSSCTHCWRAAN